VELFAVTNKQGCKFPFNKHPQMEYSTKDGSKGGWE